MEILYKLEDFPEPGDRNLYSGIQELNKNNYQSALIHFEKGINYDNEYAALFTAIIYFCGFDLPKRNPVKAMELFKKVALKWNNPVAQYFIGSMYFEGDKGIPKNKKIAFDWFLLSSEKEWLISIAFITYSYAYGEGVAEDHQESLKWLQRIVKNDDNEFGEVDDGTLYLFADKRFEMNYSKVDKKILSDVLSRTRDRVQSPIQLLDLRTNLFISDSPDIRRVLLWDILTNKKSSALAECQYRICALHLSGENNIPRDPIKAFYWAKKAAKNGNGSSCRYVAEQYEDGNVVAQDYKEAMKWYKKAHAIGRQHEATFSIGYLYYKEYGVRPDCKKAFDYLYPAAYFDNNSSAYFLMGDIHQHGKDGVPKNCLKAIACFSRAFDLGVITGATAVAIVYCRDFDKKEYEKVACEWYQKAALTGCHLAPYILKLIRCAEFNNAVDSILKAPDLGQNIYNT